MSADLTHKIDEIHEMAARTSQDVVWIREGMTATAERIDKHAERISSVEKTVSHAAGRSSAIGALAGAIVSGIGTFLIAHKIT